MSDSLPNSQDGEEACLGCFLGNAATLADARESLPLESFYNVVHREIYRQLLDFPDYKALDLVTFSQRMADMGTLQKLGGPAELARLLDVPSSPQMYRHYRAILLDKLILRRAIQGGEGIVAAVKEHQSDMGQMREAVLKQASAVELAVREPEPEETWEMVVDKIEEDWTTCYQGKKPSAMPSPWASWNLHLGGVRKGYVLLLGEEKQGKSSLAGHLAMHISHRLNERALVVTYETSVPDYIRRLACNISGVEGRFMFQPDTNRPTKEAVGALASALAMIRRSKLRVVRGHGMNVWDIAHVCRREKPVFVAVDYLLRLPRLPDCNPKEGTEGEVRANSKALFDLSSEIDGTLMVINHTAKSGDRKGESRWGASPTNDCDLALVIEKDGVHVKAQRNGPTGGVIPIFFEGKTFSFIEKDADCPYG